MEIKERERSSKIGRKDRRGKKGRYGASLVGV